jgi:hypothetical protein
VKSKLGRMNSELAKQSGVQAGCVCALSIHHDSTFALSYSLLNTKLVMYSSPAHNSCVPPFGLSSFSPSSPSAHTDHHYDLLFKELFVPKKG